METKYFIRISNWNYPKNKLYEAVQSFCKEIKHSLLDQEQRDQFPKLIKAKLKELNAQHSRCKPLEWRYRRVEDGSHFFIMEVVELHIIKCKPFFMPSADHQNSN